MLGPSWEDITEFFDSDEFATKIELHLPSGIRQILGMFDAAYAEARAGGFEDDIDKPILTIAATDAQGLQRGCICNVLGVRYALLTDPKFTGNGLATLVLAENE